MLLLISSLVGVAIWHAAALLPRSLWTTVLGALTAAIAGSITFGLLLSSVGSAEGTGNAVGQALAWATGALLGLAASNAIRARTADTRSRVAGVGTRRRAAQPERSRHRMAPASHRDGALARRGRDLLPPRRPQ